MQDHDENLAQLFKQFEAVGLIVNKEKSLAAISNISQSQDLC